MKRVDALSPWSSPSDLDKKESDERDPPQGVAPHAHRGVVGAPVFFGNALQKTPSVTTAPPLVGLVNIINVNISR